MIVIATLVVALAAVLHVLIFVLESVLWSKPGVWTRFGLADQSAADTTKPMAYNQGFYNLFLGLGAIVGLILYGVGQQTVGLALVYFTLSCMVLAAVVLTTTGKKYLSAALVQGILPLLGIVLLAVSDPLAV